MDFLGIQKTALKCVTDFGSVLRKCRKGSIFLCGLFFASKSSGSCYGFAKSMSQIFVAIAPAPLPLAQMAHQHLCGSRREWWRYTPTCYVASNMCASSTMSLHPKPTPTTHVNYNVACDMLAHSRNVHIYRRRCACVASIVCACAANVNTLPSPPTHPPNPMSGYVETKITW